MRANARNVAGCRLSWDKAVWPWAIQHRELIEHHWQQQTALNPNYFNGWVHLLSSWSIDEQNIFHGHFFRTEFKSYLYWRHRGFEDSGALDGFGSALVVSDDNQVLLGHQTSGNVNTGLLDCIGGFIDDRDCLADGRIDIDASILREISEEIGLGAGDLQRQHGYWIAIAKKQISIAIVFQARQKAADLTQRVASFLAAEDKPELQSVEAVSAAALSTQSNIPEYARCLIRVVLE